MNRFLATTLLSLAACGAIQPAAVYAQLRPEFYGWQTSLERGKALARQTGKPLFVVFRCQP
jgi:hypothetical protein